MNFFAKRFLLVLMLMSNTFAFDNEIRISGEVVLDVSVDVLDLSKNKDSIYLSTNCKRGASITVKELSSDEKKKVKNILNNGHEYQLPMTYHLFRDTSFLGTSPISLNGVTLGVEVQAH